MEPRPCTSRKTPLLADALQSAGPARTLTFSGPARIPAQ
jgi:hypothetical protein